MSNNKANGRMDGGGEREREIKSVGRRESTEGERVLVDESMER